MSAETGLVNLLKGDTAVAALVGTRIYPNVIPQDAALPAIAYQVISSETGYSHGGPDAGNHPYIQLTIEGDSYANTLAVCAACKARLSGFRGDIGNDRFEAIFLENEFDGFNLDPAVHTRRQDYRLRYKEI